MEVIESFIEGKFGDPARCEDVLVLGRDFIAAIDGVTSKACPLIAGRSGGRFAADVCARVVAGFAADITARQAIHAVTEALSHALAAEDVDLPDTGERPSCVFALYSRARREIWRVGDCPVMADGKFYDGGKEIDDLTSSARAVVLEMARCRGMSDEDLLRDDPGRAFILPLLRDQALFANTEGPYGYGVIDGRSVPEKYIEVIDVGQAKEIVLATDGYPGIFMTLAESEKNLARILREDPLLCRLHKSTKGAAPGQKSFDDRAYVRFRI